MSQIIVNIPDCATGSHDDNDVITITTQDCPVPPTPPPGPAPIVSTWGIVIVGVVLIAAFIATAMVRINAHDQKPKKLEAENAARKIELDAEIRMAALRKRCSTCGDIYEPSLSEQ